MELVYAARAIRRYWWITVAAMVVGAVAALIVADRGASYEAEAMVLVVPATESAFGGTSTDRYVQNQLVVLQSERLAQVVAREVGGGSQAVRSSVTFEQLAGTDIVAVRATTTSPERSQAIANSYVESYLVVLQDQILQSRNPELDRIEEEIATTAALLDEVNERVRETMEPFIAAADGQVVPTVDQVDPSLATERDVVRNRYLDLLDNRDAVADELTAVQTSGQFVQEATLPDAGVGRSSVLLLAGVFAGALLGGLGAVGFARLSPRVLDVDEVVERLDRPVVASMPSESALHSGDWLLSSEVPPSLVPVVNELCVRAESAVSPGAPLAVVVAGAQSGSGATTVAAAMATHLSRSDEVLLIDLSLADPELSRRAGPGASGVSSFVENGQTRRKGSSAAASLDTTPTALGGLSFAGLGADPNVRLQRQHVAQLVKAARSQASVIVIDAGPLMSSSTSAYLAELADVVVLTIPLKSQRGAALDVVSRQLGHVSGTVLPVVTPGRHGRRGRLAPESDASEAAAADDLSDDDLPDGDLADENLADESESATSQSSR